jgi:NTP pyrophosphatase (non-canonical NTP hydrolase)
LSKPIGEVVNEVLVELAHAMATHDSMKSSHEGYAVLLEEVEELWDVVKSNPKKLSNHKERMREEAIQVAAMAMRFVIDVCDKE